ncbi:unnamed protein product, partial [Mesorhabditis spiculigera]
MDRLEPLQPLDADYYVGDYAHVPIESDNDSSSDDELQNELKRLAGIPNCAQAKKEKERNEFVDEMESDLDESITEYARNHMGGSNQNLAQIEAAPPSLADPAGDIEMGLTSPGPSKSALKSAAPASPQLSKKKKKVTINEDVAMEGDDEEPPLEEDTTNPIKKMFNESVKQAKAERPDFYDSDEDEDNERWIADQRRRSKGQGSSKMKDLNEKQRRAKVDDGSDAVLSCPGCMSLITRDCQRHELYKDQYRAMFVENVEVLDELMTIEATGKAKRNKRKKARKAGVEPEATTEDLFYAVVCSVCRTSVGVADLEEVYHFFNVLAGYS